MIRKTECYIPACDICEKPLDEGAEFLAHFDNEADAYEHATLNSEYGGCDGEMIDGKLCCPRCYAWDDDDELVIRGKEQK